MQQDSGTIRLLFATEAYGMGIDVSDIRHIVHVGPPNNIESMFYKFIAVFMILIIFIH